jgi:hypothetical protein
VVVLGCRYQQQRLSSEENPMDFDVPDDELLTILAEAQDKGWDTNTIGQELEAAGLIRKVPPPVPVGPTLMSRLGFRPRKG